MGKATYSQAKLPTVRHAPNNRIHAPNRAIDMHPKGIDMHPKVSIYFAPNFRQARVVDARPAPRSRVVLHVAHVASGDCLRAVGANPTEVFRPEHPQQLTADLARSVR